MTCIIETETIIGKIAKLHCTEWNSALERHDAHQHPCKSSPNVKPKPAPETMQEHKKQTMKCASSLATISVTGLTFPHPTHQKLAHGSHNLPLQTPQGNSVQNLPPLIHCRPRKQRGYLECDGDYMRQIPCLREVARCASWRSTCSGYSYRRFHKSARETSQRS